MDLTSLRRVKYTLNITKADEDSLLAALVGSVSSQIVTYLRRADRDGGDGIELKSRTEYLDPIPGQRRFYPWVYPIQSVTSLYTDALGRYEGNEALVSPTQYIIDADKRSLVLQMQTYWPTPGLAPMPRGARLTYVAGLAADPVLSVWTKSADVGGSLSTKKYVRGEDSGAIGYTRAAGATSISIECLSGVFLEGEQIKEYNRADASAMDGGLKEATNVSATLTTCTSRSLAEAHPVLGFVCERYIAHWKQNRDSFHNLTVSQDGATRFSRADMSTDYEFLPEHRALLKPYRNLLGAQRPAVASGRGKGG